ncbi:MAG: hypothetical protein J7513_00535 [Solirubrobacteraceae bacterium]|nr:hypothetical protein [Solirubrobacteraceae bacterium]
MFRRLPGDRLRSPRRRQPLHLALLTLFATLVVAAPAVAADAAPAAPKVTTGAATAIGPYAATLTATVDPVDETSAEYGFEYGRDASYGNTTATVLLPITLAGPVQLNVTELAPGAVYHFRAFAKKDGIAAVYGDDQSFTTAPAPAGVFAPTVAALPMSDVTTTSVTVNARVNPGGQATTVRFEWGATTTYGKTVDDAGAGAGYGDVIRSTTLTGLTTGTTYHLRIGAKNASGTAYTKDISFMPGRGLTKLVADVSAPSIQWGGTVAFEGRLHGASANNVRLEILRQDYPYKEGEWTRIGTTGTLDDGTWGLRLKGIYTSTKLRARVIDEPTVYSNLVKLGAELQVPFVKGKLGRSAMQARGAVFPVAKKAKITLQRYAGGGRWVNVKPITGKRSKSGRLTFKVAIKRNKSTQKYRAYVDPKDGGAHALTGSATVTVPKR